MQDFRSLSERGTADAEDDWVGEQSQPMHGSFHERERSSFTSLTSSEIDSDRRNSSLSCCSVSHMDDSATVTYDIESGIFELEL